MDNISLAQVSLRESLGKHFISLWPDCGSVRCLHCTRQHRDLYETLSVYCSGSHRVLGSTSNRESATLYWLSLSLQIEYMGQANV
jgi:hypothetical protein